MMELVQDLFILFWCSFVPDVGFRNGWFASSDWPANKRERDVIFDPFLGVRNIICFAPGKLCFPLREIDFVTENSLPARGGKTPPESSFFTGTTVARPKFRLFKMSSPTPPAIRSNGARKRAGAKGGNKARRPLRRSGPATIPHRKSGFDGRLLRETTHRFAV